MNNEEKNIMKNLLCAAIEGGSNYWYMINDHNRKEVGAKYIHETPFQKEGFIMIECPAGEGYRVDIASLDYGWNIFKENHPHHYDDALNENEDLSHIWSRMMS